MHDESDKDTAEYLPLVTEAETQRPRTASSQVRAKVGGLSHPGKVRPNNEDSFLAARFGRSMLTLTTNLSPDQVPDRYEEVGFALVVADGIGGAAAGEVASSLAITSRPLGLRTTMAFFLIGSSRIFWLQMSPAARSQ